MKQLFLSILILLLPMLATADAVEINGIYYNLYDLESKGKVAEVTQGSYYSGEVVIPESVEYGGVTYTVTSIGESAFYDCKGLTSVTIPNSVTSISYGAFERCSGLTSMTIPNSVTSIDVLAFADCTGLTTMTIPNSVTSIGNSAFYGCKGLISVTIPNSVTSISYGAFEGCSGLTSVTIPNSVTSIDVLAFLGCSGLTSVTIPNSVTSIGNSAFDNCSGLTSVTIGTGMQNIGRQTFAGCSKLTDVYCYADNVPNTRSNAFQDSNIGYATLHVLDASINLYKTTAPWSRFGTIMGMGGSAPVTQKCATPTINFANGILSFSCETEDVEFVSEITSADISKFYSKEVSFTGKYTVTVYAKKEGYDDSDTVTKEIDISGGSSSGVPGDVNGDGVINAADIVEIVKYIMSSDGGGGISSSIEGTWYLKSTKGYRYYVEDGTVEPHNSNKNPDVEYDDNSKSVEVTLSIQGEDIYCHFNGAGYNPDTFIFKKMGGNEYICKRPKSDIYDRIVIKDVSKDRFVFEWWDNYFKDAGGTVKDTFKDNPPHFSFALYTLMR